MTEWNYSRCEACGHETETMQFGGHGRDLRCPKCLSLRVKLLGYPVWRDGKRVYQPEPDPSKYVRPRIETKE